MKPTLFDLLDHIEIDLDKFESKFWNDGDALLKANNSLPPELMALIGQFGVAIRQLIYIALKIIESKNKSQTHET